MTITVHVEDVRAASNLNNDYSGQLGLKLPLQITDRANGPSGTEIGTVQTASVDVPVPCVTTPGTTVGGTCDVATTVDTVVPGAVLEQKRAIWELGQLDATRRRRRRPGLDHERQHRLRAPGRVRPVIRGLTCIRTVERCRTRTRGLRGAASGGPGRRGARRPGAGRAARDLLRSSCGAGRSASASRRSRRRCVHDGQPLRQVPLDVRPPAAGGRASRGERAHRDRLRHGAERTCAAGRLRAGGARGARERAPRADGLAARDARAGPHGLRGAAPAADGHHARPDRARWP